MKNKSTISTKKTLQNFTPKKKVSPSSPPVSPKPMISPLQQKFNKLLTLKGTEYDELYNEVKDSMSEIGKTILRDRNFLLIQEELLKYIKNNQKGLPTVSLLSTLTKLSRVTVTKHLKEMLSVELEEDRKLQHKYLFDAILTNVGRKAMNGDLKSSKLYLDTILRLEEKDTIKMYVQNQQNNILFSNEK